MPRHDPGTIHDLRQRFLPVMSQGTSALESLGGEGGADTSLSAVADRWARSEDFLLRFIRTELGDDAELVDLAGQVLANGREGLELIGGHRAETEAPPDHLAAGLEVIVETDGSRPAFLIRDDAIVEDSSPPGMWTELLLDPIRKDGIEAVLRAVGRIDITGDPWGREFAGTGWLIAPDLVATNRHVAQLFVDFGAAGGPRIDEARAPRLDFGHEHRGRDSVDPRPLTEMVFCGSRVISRIDHSVLDLAVFRLGAATLERAPARLAIGGSEDFSAPRTQIFLAGYPGEPDPASLGSVTETDRVLRLLFAKLWGRKRLAPGKVMPRTLGNRTLRHDATTLGGNSGSLVMGLDSAPAVTAIHYGGSWGGERENWAHPLATVMEEEGLPGLQHRTLAALCAAEGVEVAEF